MSEIGGVRVDAGRTATSRRRLEDLVAIVTGGSRGIGAGIAMELAAAGAKVAILARDAERGGRVVDAIAAAGGHGWFVAADLAREADVARAVEAARDRFGAVHLLVSDAALTPSRAGTAAGGGTAGGTVTDIPLDIWLRYFDVNVSGAFFACRHAVPHMVDAGYGSIVVVNSIGSRHAMAGDVGYASSKAALSGLTRAMAVDLAPTVRVNEILCGFFPNPTDNPVHRALLTDPTTHRAIIDANLVGRAGHPADVGQACVFLLSPESGFVTGQSLVVDGGAHTPIRLPHLPKA